MEREVRGALVVRDRSRELIRDADRRVGVLVCGLFHRLAGARRTGTLKAQLVDAIDAMKQKCPDSGG